MESLSNFCSWARTSYRSNWTAKLLRLMMTVAFVAVVVTPLETTEQSIDVDEAVLKIKFPLNYLKNSFSIKNEGRSGRMKRQVAGCPQPPNNCNSNSLYRTSDGTCNNLAFDTLAGSAGTPFTRFLPPNYADGVRTPRQTTPALPRPRQVSFAMTNIAQRISPINISLMVMQFGQFLDHDITFTPEFNISGSPCCNNGTNPTSNNAECFPIDVSGDPFYGPKSIVCLNFVRSLAASPTCTSNVREQINMLTSFIDGSQIYGSSRAQQLSLRSGIGGKLLTLPGQQENTGTCPATKVCPFSFLPVVNNNFVAGDGRVEEQPGLTSMHHLFVRCHNHFATELSISQPGTSDEILFQETRRLVGALLQQITYGEFLPTVLGGSYVDAHDLRALPVGFRQYLNYFSFLNPSTPNVFATAAYRFGHSLIRDVVNLPNGVNVNLAQSFNNHPITLNPQSFPSLFLQGTSGNPSSAMDQHLVPAVTNFLFATSPFTAGSDLYSRNIQRGRDHGIRSYNEWRAYCNFSTFTNFTQLNGVVGAAAATAFANLYSNVNHIDLFPAAIAELPFSNDGILGPTFTCLLGEYFFYLRFGDRYFFENIENPYRFSFNQLDIIHNTRLSALICIYTPTLEIQRNVFLQPGPGNPIVACSEILQNTLPTQIRNFFS